jgi:lipopolysaccharide assembly outer membrane protein LptD (OstA)
MRSYATVLAALLLGVLPALAQTPPPVVSKAGKAAAPLADDGEMHVRAEVQERVAKGHYRFSGFVDLIMGDLRVQADTVDLFEEEVNGKVHRRVEATGEVVFFQGEQRLSGTSATLDLDTGKGRLLKARGFLEPGVFVEADEMDRLSAKVYRIKGGKFSSCYQPHPRWSFTAENAKVTLGSHILATLVDFHVMDVPTPIFLPVFYYPIHEDQRSTGLLFPQFSTGSLKGFGVSTGFFWAMARSYDQTLTLEHYEKLGTGFGHEFRYQLASPSSGTFRSYALQHNDGTGNWDYNFQWDATQVLPDKFTARLSVHQNSDTTFQQQIQTNIDLALSRTENSTLSLSRSFGFGNLLLQASRNRTFFSNPGGTPTDTEIDHLPSARLTRSPLRIARTGLLLDYDLSADQLGRSDNSAPTNRYSRYDAGASIQRPLVASFLSVTPRFHVRYREWGEQIDDTGKIVPQSIDQTYEEGSLDVRGPKFSRVFLNEGGFYSEKIKHEIGPEALFTYRSAIDNFDRIPKLDGQDWSPAAGSFQIDYSLVQSFKAKRPGPTGKLQSYEFLSWVLHQSYYSDVLASRYDPNYQSSAFDPLAPTLTPTPTPVVRHNSPISSNVRFKPVQQVNVGSTLEYDIYAHALSRMNLNSRFAFDRVTLDGAWNRSTTFDAAGTPTVVTDSLRGGANLKLIPDKVSAAGSAAMDLRADAPVKLLNAQASLRYDVQCCGFIVDYNYFKYSDTLKESRFSFRIQLANIGSMTNFNNQDAYGPRGVGYGGRP